MCEGNVLYKKCAFGNSFDGCIRGGIKRNCTLCSDFKKPNCPAEIFKRGNLPSGFHIIVQDDCG